jgi:hypothetical protein
MDSLDFIRSQSGHMSQTQIRRCLGLREAEYRELLADAKQPPVALPGQRDRDRVYRHKPPRPRADPVQAARLLQQATQMGRDALLKPRLDEERQARDLLLWLLRQGCGLSISRTARLLGLSEYGVATGVARYAEALAQGQESSRQTGWRSFVCARLMRERP